MTAVFDGAGLERHKIMPFLTLQHKPAFDVSAFLHLSKRSATTASLTQAQRTGRSTLSQMCLRGLCCPAPPLSFHLPGEASRVFWLANDNIAAMNYAG